MQTFLPYPDVDKSLKVLDYRRLGKQRLEARQIISIVYEGVQSRWKNHPAVVMWKSNPELLIHYYNSCVEEWIGRGYKNTMQKIKVNINNIEYPWWWGNEIFHYSHQSNLCRKNEIYNNYFDIEPNWLYAWPSNNKSDGFRIVIPQWAKETEYINPLSRLRYMKIKKIVE